MTREEFKNFMVQLGNTSMYDPIWSEHEDIIVNGHRVSLKDSTQWKHIIVYDSEEARTGRYVNLLYGCGVIVGDKNYTDAEYATMVVFGEE